VKNAHSVAGLFLRGGIVMAIMMLSACTRTASLGAAFAPVTGSRLTLELTPGPDYRASIRVLFLFKLPLYPQVACWIETEDGRYVSTVSVTAKGAKKNFFSAPAAGRPEALPVWYHRQQAAGGTTDAVSAATPSGSSTRDWSAARLQPGKYVAMLEINRSYDYNATYTRANAGVNGQPSLVYRADLVVGKESFVAQFVPFGTGSLDGSNGNITPGVEGLTTALTLLSKAQVTYQPN
jgi:hypothetical protein